MRARRLRFATTATVVVLTLASIVANPARAQSGDASGAAATSRAAQGAASLTEALEALLGEEARAKSYDGVSVAVFDATSILAVAHFGFEDRDLKTKTTDATAYRWASISKPIAAIVAMKLARRGVLDLDADVRAYVPEFPQKPHVVTARLLLCHQGGISHYGPNVVATEREGADSRRTIDVVSALDAFKETPLVAVPGSAYVYTTYGYMLLGAVCERAAKRPFLDLVSEFVAKPCGAETLLPDAPWIDVPHRARGVRVVRGERVPSLDRDVSWKLPGGGFVSPIGDLARFGSALLSERLLDADLKREMWTPRKLADGKATRYGYGFNVETKDGRRRVFHSGAQEKTATFLLLFPDEPGGGLGAAVMCQNEGAKTGGLADAAAALVRKRRAVEAAETAPPRAR